MTTGFTETEATHQEEAERLLDSRLADMRTYLGADDPYADEEPIGDAELGSVYDYGLSWERDSYSYHNDTLTVRHVLSTGGPHDEFVVTFDRDGSVSAATFVYLPWFDRVEIDLYTQVGPEACETVVDFYERFFGESLDFPEA